MSKVADDQSVVVGFVAHQADGVAAGTIWGNDVRVVNSKVDLIALGLEKAEGLGFGLGNVANEATGWVGNLLTVKLCF